MLFYKNRRNKTLIFSFHKLQDKNKMTGQKMRTARTLQAQDAGSLLVESEMGGRAFSHQAPLLWTVFQLGD